MSKPNPIDPNNPKQSNPKLVQFILTMAIIEFLVIVTILFLSNTLYGSYLPDEKSFPLWIGGLAPVQVILFVMLGKYTKEKN